MSSFQGRTQEAALDGLLLHEPEGIQLTPGNLPSAGFRERVRASGVRTRAHHGFCWTAYRQPVYDAEGRPRLQERDRSLHPPRTRPPKRRGGRPGEPGLIVTADLWLTLAAEHDLLLETMTPGYALGSGVELELAMEMGLRLAVDVSHLEIQRYRGVLSETTHRRVLNYARIEEVHVSTSRRGHDAHRPLTPDTPGLAWARERIDETIVVLESYWHRLDVDAQRRQLDLLRDPGPTSSARRSTHWR